MKYSSLKGLMAAIALLFAQAAASGHGVTVNVDLNAGGTKLVTDRPIYADRDITAITAIDQSLGYDQDDDVPGFAFSGGVQALGGVISLRVVEPTHFWNPTHQLQATTNASVVLDSLFYFVPAAGNVGPIGESLAGHTSISSTLPVALVDPSAPPASDHHFAAYDLTTGQAQIDPSVGAYGLVVEFVDATAGGTIASAPFIIGLDNGLTHSVSSFGPGGDGDHQQPANDGTQYGAAVGAFQGQLANTVVWNYNGSGKYSEAAKWDGNPLQGPGNAETTILLANGSTTAVSTPSAVVMVDGAYTAGTIVLDNIGGTTYTIAGDDVSGHGLTLNNNGAGASVNVVGGNHTITTNLTLAEPTLFNMASASSLLIAGGQISESVPGVPVCLTGGGTLTIDSVSTYSGPTTINGGTLQTTSRGSISSGALALNTDNYVASLFRVGNGQPVASLAVTGDATGSATISVGNGQTLTVGQPIAMDANTALQLTGNGKLRFAAISGTANVGRGVTVAITSGATLELAGSVSALSPVVNVTNNSDQASGGALVVSGTHQQVGDIDGSGTTQINAGSDLTANHLIQNALIISGAAGNPGLVTIDASDASGNPLGQSSGFALAGSLVRSGPFGEGVISSANLSGGGSSEVAAPSLGNSISDSNLSSVPEPSTLLLVLVAITGLAGQRFALRRRGRRNYF